MNLEIKQVGRYFTTTTDNLYTSKEEAEKDIKKSILSDEAVKDKIVSCLPRTRSIYTKGETYTEAECEAYNQYKADLLANLNKK